MSIHDSRKIEDVKVMLVKGQKGDAGTSIESIEKTSTSGLVDTYTVTLTDGSKTTFQVTNGNGIASIEKTSTSGLVDTYTITFDDGTTTTFTVTNGSGASVDIVDNLNSTDATKALSANQGHLLGGNFATIEQTSTASQPYAVGEFLVFGGKLCKVTSAIATDDTLAIGTNITYDTVGAELSAINSNLSMRYNSQTNYIEVEKNGTWYNYKYFDPTSQPLVPTMTSDTTPYGVAGSNSVLGVGNYQAFRAFDNDDNYYWECVQNASHPYVYYKFTEAVYVDKAYVKFYALQGEGSEVDGRTVKLRYSDDGINWYDCSSVVAPTSISFYIDSNERNAHQYWALYFETVATSGWAAVNTVQFYGYETAV